MSEELVFVGAGWWHVRLHKGKQMFEMFAKVLSWDKTGHLGLTLLRLLVLGCTRACSVSLITLPWEVSITSLPSRQLCLPPGLCSLETRWGDSPSPWKESDQLLPPCKIDFFTPVCHTGDTAGNSGAACSHSRAMFTLLWGNDPLKTPQL